MSTWPGLDERDDHYLGLAGANVVATEALLMLQDNLADVVAARAMMCVHGDAGLGKTLSVNASLRALAPADTCRVQFRARPTPRDIRHVLFDALGISGTPPTRPIEFDALLKDALSERFRVLVCDEAQWLSRECFELWQHLWDDRRTDIAIVFVGGDCYQVLRREPMLRAAGPRPRSRPDAAAEAGPDAPDLPRFLHPHIRNYRSKVFSQLGSAGFARTDAVYRHRRDATCHWLSTRPEPGAAAVTCQSVQLFLTWLVHDSPSRHHTLARLRGAQAGFRPHGLMLNIPHPSASSTS